MADEQAKKYVADGSVVLFIDNDGRSRQCIACTAWPSDPPVNEMAVKVADALNGHDALLDARDSLKALLSKVKATGVIDVTVEFDEKVKAEVLALRDALRKLLPYVKQGRRGASKAVEAAEKALKGKTDGN